MRTVEGPEIGDELRRMLEGTPDTLPITSVTVKGGPSGYSRFEISGLTIIHDQCTISDTMIRLVTQNLTGIEGLLAWLAPGVEAPDGIDPISEIVIQD